MLRNMSCAAMFLLLPLSLFAQTSSHPAAPSAPYCLIRSAAGDGAVSRQEASSSSESETHGLNPADLDRSAKACVNFFQFA
ncbi:MAG: hypothetical protein WBD73_13610, partial [Candidatus Acidiferrales bacterium]